MKFLQSSELNSEIEKIFSNAEKEIIIVSPYIKLHHRIKSILELKKESPKIKVKILFGKDLNTSMKDADFDFFVNFPNIEILYNQNLHAKYYSNENHCIITSLNLYDFSQNNNIEIGVKFNKNDLSYDVETHKYINTLIGQSDLIYKTEPIFERNLLINRYVDFKITVNEIGVTDETIGYCIRTGVEIPFNPKMPFCEKAFKSWSKYGDENYPEKYCHLSGEPSSGKTNFSHPILKKTVK